MDNLVLLCPLHHRAVHEGGWQVEMDEGGVPRFFNPLGVRMPQAPEAPDIGGLLPDGNGEAAPANCPPPPPQDFGSPAGTTGRHRGLARNHPVARRTHRLELGTRLVPE